ncbi:hypothetical protein [Streptomyces sp. NPDC051561]|uniref:hypothetical protein n=1 Tax=Streptomyces sp. NPDC051561 TaxID=3365658 RepID=UPI0037ACDBC6
MSPDATPPFVGAHALQVLPHAVWTELVEHSRGCASCVAELCRLTTPGARWVDGPGQSVPGWLKQAVLEQIVDVLQTPLAASGERPGPPSVGGEEPAAGGEEPAAGAAEQEAARQAPRTGRDWRARAAALRRASGRGGCR